MIARNRQTNARSHQLLEAKLLERVCFERRKEDRKLQAGHRARRRCFSRPANRAASPARSASLVDRHEGAAGIMPAVESGQSPTCSSVSPLPAIARTFPTASSVCFRIARASSRNARPASVRRTDLAVRSSNCTPISSSRSRICRLNDGCETCNRCIAARETFSISATATK